MSGSSITLLPRAMALLCLPIVTGSALLLCSAAYAEQLPETPAPEPPTERQETAVKSAAAEELPPASGNGESEQDPSKTPVPAPLTQTPTIEAPLAPSVSPASTPVLPTPPPAPTQAPQHPVEALVSRCPTLGTEQRRELLLLVFDKQKATTAKLPGSLLLHNSAYFDTLQTDLGRCKERLKSGQDGGEKDLIGRAERLVSLAIQVFSNEEELRLALSGVAQELRPLVSLRVEEKEWPPPDISPVSADGWQVLKRFQEQLRSLQTMAVWREDRTLENAIAARRMLEEHCRTFCDLRRWVQTVDLSEADRLAHYYSWTATRRSFETTLTELRNRQEPSWCQQ